MKNIKNAHLGFKLRSNKVDSLKNRNFTVPIIDEYIWQAYLIWLDNISKRNEDLDNEEDLNSFIKSVKLKTTLKNGKYVSDYPNDYFKKESARCLATKGKCSKIINLLSIPKQNKNESVKDPLFKPSFEWEESFIELKDKIYISTDGFETSFLELEYIAYPKRPANPEDIGGYSYPDGTVAKQQDMEVNEVNAEKILDIAVLLASMDITNQDINIKQNKLQNLNKL